MKKVKFSKVEVGDTIFVPLFNKTYRVAYKDPVAMTLKRGKDEEWVVTLHYYQQNPQYFLLVEEW